MVPIGGREFLMGSSRFYPEEQPEVVVSTADFWIDRYPVTTAEFSVFVAATGYLTAAERPLDPDDYPGASLEFLHPGGLVFQRTDHPVPLTDVSRWWAYRPGANWRSPLAVPTDPSVLADHPVVQVAYEDAEAYARWRGVRLPTETEWEVAARGGLEGADYCWGDDPYPGGRQLANTWQGEFPWQNLTLDGYESTSPVGAFPANGYGLHDMAGNVWEWTSTWWQGNHGLGSSCCAPGIDRGGAESSRAVGERFGRRVIKGGSHLCAPNYCLRFRPAARQPEAVDTSTCHLGFRCASDSPNTR